MSQNSSKFSGDQEIDLSALFRGIGGFFESISLKIFKGILFLQRNLLVLGVLFAVGVGAGYYLDHSGETYDNKLVVSPNFDSADYLYSKVQLINSKLKEGDLTFLKKVVGIKEPKKLLAIEIKPINDIFKFIENNRENFDMLNLMAEDMDVSKIMEDEITSKNYTQHEITFVTSSKISNEEVVVPLLKYLNDSEFYDVMLKENLKNLKITIAVNDSIISKSLKLMEGVANSGSVNSQKTVFFNENNQMGDVLKMVDELNKEQVKNRLDLERKNKIVKERDISINIRKEKKIYGKYKLILPFLLMGIFIFAGAFRSYYRRQMVKLNA